eukprot:Skav232114  [mRNA]  locus=scaffold2353:120064:124525:+ [translate_table: standard]
MTVMCVRIGCSKAPYDGQPGSYCSKTCRDMQPAGGAAPAAPAPAVTCARQGCNKAPYDGQPGSYCSKTCRDMPAPVTCARNGCNKPPHNGKQGEYCSRSCKAAGQAGSLTASFSRCVNPACQCMASFDGQPSSHCCKNCRRGIPCTRNVHTVPSAQQSSATAICIAPGCNRPTWNQQVGEFCGKTCRQKYSQLVPSVQLKDYASLKGQAQLWAQKVWPSGLGRFKFYGNRGLGDPSCPAVSKYEAGLAALGLNDSSKSEFAWHGTKTAANVRSICWDNLDPNLRNGQAYGRGEYFSADANDSSSYAGSTGYIIIFLLLLGPHHSKHNTNYRVVDNPTDGRTMYCVPVGVVDYRSSGDPGLKGSGNF